MKKIMFNDRHGLTKAVLEGRKTMTRRETSVPVNLAMFHKMKSNGNALFQIGESYDFVEVKPLYSVGEIIAIAQSYSKVYAEKINDFVKHNYHLAREDAAENFKRQYEQSAGWRNKMFVKADLMPHHIRITDVKVERLQDISKEDCLKEGIKCLGGSDYMNIAAGVFTFEGCKTFYPLANYAFASLIDNVGGKGTWDRNPWVFAYSFELID